MSTNSLSSSRISELLIALQPFRGMHYSVAIHTAVDAAITFPQLKELARLGYLELVDGRFSFTAKAYTFLSGGN